jgi:CDP-glucose 4,6-dehydratase
MDTVEGDHVSGWSGRRVFVTGATGLLGSWLTDVLLARGATVVCLVRDWMPLSQLIGSGTINRAIVVRGELEDAPLLVRALNEYEIDSVFHLGAQTIVGVAARAAVSTFEANIRGTWNLLEACRTCARTVQRVVIASSDKAYGTHEQLPYTEDTPLRGRYPYDVSKSCADLISLSYFHTYGTPVAITRCGNLFGGGDLNFNRLVPGTIVSALRGERPIIRSDGTYVREYFYVRDAVDAYLQLADRLPDEATAGEAFNFGSGEPLTVLQLVRQILELAGRADLEPVVLNEASHEIPAQYLDCTKAARVLGWRAGHGLRDGLRETIAWYRERCVAPPDAAAAAGAGVAGGRALSRAGDGA